MDRRILLGMAAVLLAASAAPAAARDNIVVGDGRCDCFCETANAGSYNTYDSVGYGCGALENRTCNIENPQTGLIETGRLWGCSPANGQSISTGTLTLDPGTTGGGGGSGPRIQPGLIGPLNGILRQ
jgi:hypothetical protein